MKYLFPSLVRVVFKVLCAYVIGMLLFNAYLWITHTYRLSGIAYIAQRSFEKHNYLPQHDLDALNNLIAAYTYTEDNESKAGKGIPNLNRIVTDVRIVAYQQGDDMFTKRFFGDPEKKVQQGDIVYVGLAYKYHFITPMLWWEWQRPDFDNSRQGSLQFQNDNAQRQNTSVIGSDPSRSFFSVSADESFNNLTNSAVEVDTAGIGQVRGWTEKNEDGVYDYSTEKMKYSDRTLLIKPMVAMNDYADLSQELTYSGGY